jgi:glycosyltransferase involved in cell wall biosynthesis
VSGASPRLLLIAPTVLQYAGGTETVVVHLARRLAHRAELTVVVGRTGAPPALPALPFAHRLVEVPFAGRDTAANRTLAGLLRLNPFRVESASFFRALARRRLDPTQWDAVLTFYESDAAQVARRWPGLRGRALHLLPGVSRRSFFRHVDPADVVFLGYRAGPRVERKWGIRVPALPLGVDEAFFAAPLRADPGSRTLLFVGRLDASKHADWLADWFAASGLAARGFALEIVGDGPLGAALAARHRGTPGIRLLGRLGEAAVIERLSAARLLLHPSDLESFGLVVLEAMAAGVPVITHDLPGIRAWAGDRPTYAPHLDGAGWLDAVRRFDDERRWAETAADNRAFARGFGWETIATRVLERLQARPSGPR